MRYNLAQLSQVNEHGNYGCWQEVNNATKKNGKSLM